MKMALDNNDLHALNAYLATLPQRTKDELLRVAGENFGFQTYEAGGARYMLASALRKLLARYERPPKSLQSVQHYVALSLKQAFGLPPRAARTMFATWEHFGIACLKSETPMARERSPGHTSPRFPGFWPFLVSEPLP